ncbi:sorting nexin-16 [Contarinia nasturtii]|uniref:sorting nexin-16 n=1 Tax=Contarinia nasturtii TaxID=265458 RepID=UPI0012D400C3|nr:sorting nexin-16 [Contarinia nasturtii]XP_031629875.1 sorting nexin-16 [Contarinia nasturtii]XP_031629876.1 sorting nexin-16 [Contarinia nasturtii]
MSQRALKKRELSLQKQEKETHQIYRKQAQQQNSTLITAQKPKYTQRTHSNSSVLSKNSTVIKSNQISDKTNIGVSKQKFYSTPNLASISIDSDSAHFNQVHRSHSESDLSWMPEANALVNAKSEFHLKSIASTQVPSFQSLTTSTPNHHFNSLKNTNVKQQQQQQMESPSNFHSKRFSIQSGLSGQTASSMTSSASTDSTQPPTVGFCDPDNVRIPIVGYEVMEERARFTVFKLRIENPFTNDCWLVLRRYTDFQRLNNKLKSIFPHLPALTLPRKKLFGDNFSSLFLSNRVQGLQLFINAVMVNETYRNSQPVRDFFCLDEPPTYSESIEECRAIFEAQEETINHLKLQLRAKDEIILSMQQQLNNEIEKNRALSTAINFSYENCDNCSKKFDELMKCQTTVSKNE